MIKYFDPIISMNKPVHPITDMVNQVRTYRKHHDEKVLDYILNDFVKCYLDDLKEGPVEFATSDVFCLPDGETYKFNYNSIIPLIDHAEKYGIDLTYKTNPYEVNFDSISWIMDIKD